MINKIITMKHFFYINEIFGLILIIYIWKTIEINHYVYIVKNTIGIICLVNVVSIWLDKNYSNRNVIGVPTLLSKPREIMVLLFLAFSLFYSR